MKKLLVILLTLLMILALPVLALAEEAATEAAVETDENGFEVGYPETEPLEEGPKTTFGFFPATLVETLPIMGMGMLGIFLVTLVIILAVLVLSKLGGGAKEE